MKYLFFSFTLLLLSCSQPSGGEQQSVAEESLPKPELICKEIRNADEYPESPLAEVYVRMGDYQMKVADVMTCMPIDKSEYASQGIPDGALSALWSWWAGAGDYFYVVADGENFKVMHKSVDEAQEAPAAYEKIMLLSKNGELIAPQ